MWKVVADETGVLVSAEPLRPIDWRAELKISGPNSVQLLSSWYPHVLTMQLTAFSRLRHMHTELGRLRLRYIHEQF